MVDKSLHKYVERIEATHIRAIKIRFFFKTKVDIIIVYAPPAKSGDIDTPNDIKEAFYDKLQDMIDNTPKGNRLIIMGDMNARI